MPGEKKEFYHWLEDCGYLPPLKNKVRVLFELETGVVSPCYMELAEVEP